MRNLGIILLVAVAYLVSCAVALAQSQKMRPGLWEVRFTMMSQGGEMDKAMREMEQQMAAMPPEQRKMMEQMMGQQGAAMGTGGSSVKVCVTKEQAERDEMPQQEGDCTQNIVERTADTVKIAFRCTGDPPTSGESVFTLATATAYTGKTTTETTVAGKPERMSMEQSGRWLSADCGAIQPRPD